MRRTTLVFPTVALGGLCTIFLSSPQLWPQQVITPSVIMANAGETLRLPEAPKAQTGRSAQPASEGEPAAPHAESGASQNSPDAGDVSGTVMDTNGDVVPGAAVSIEGGTTASRQSQASDDNGFFEFKNVAPGDAYRVAVSAQGFEPWVSEPVSVKSGQYFGVSDIKLRLKAEASSITVVANPEQIAVEQVHLAEQQRVFGLIPNFYVVYDSKNAVPLTTKLKFRMALKVSIDPVSIVGAAFIAAINQAADRPSYQQGWKGYGQRFGQEYADGLTDIMIGGAILPSLLHQDPRYFYQGTGTVKSRTLHALSNPFICKGDNGKLQPNYSSIGGDLASSALSNLYYPEQDRGIGMTFQSLAITTAERAASSLFQEFVLRKLTPSANRGN